ncbi:MAG: amidohydrolase [Oscillospiraceae bacterium]|nr:amidohydrolase [Oscillospiraceae bacterium]
MIAITNGKVVTVTGDTYEQGTVLVENGKIVAVGANIDIPADAEIINAEGMWVTPGLIDPHTHMCNFNEPRTNPSIPLDGNEMSDPITPQVRAIDAVNPYDYAVDVVRQAGFTTVCILPGSANLIGGRGTVIKLRKANTAEEMEVPGCEQMKFAMGENPKRCYGTDRKLPMTRMGVAALIRETLYKAKVYSDKLKAAETDPSKAPEPDFRLDALVPVVRGEMRCRIHAHRSDDIMTAIRYAEEFGLDYTIEHCTEGHMIVDALKKRNIRCTIGPHLWAPTKQELWNMTIENAGILANAGLQVSLTADEGSRTAYLPATIGLLMRNGLSEKAAFEGVTINPAKTLGLEDRVGSLEVGKDADIAIFDGHPFSSLSLCRLSMIDGEVVHNIM